MAVSTVVETEKDKFGIERFDALKAQFAHFKLDKDFQRRYDKIITLFTYRRDIAYELHNLELEAKQEYAWGYRQKIEAAKERLKNFKTVDFYLDATKTLLDEVRKDAATKPPPRVRRNQYYL